ncbi:MAG: DUF58 domain-containing protein [Chloroflexi bacterium]|nr:DUF58 domain-containing protein [Chloroflexota bacterium]
MMFKSRWLYVLLGVLLVGGLLRQPALVIIALLTLFTVGVAWAWNRYALVGVEYQRALSETRVFPGETVGLTVRLANRKLVPLAWLEMADEFPKKLPLLKGKLEVSSRPTIGYLAHLASLHWYERVSWRYELTAAARGYYAFGPLTLRSGDAFGLFQQEERREQMDHLIVYPRLVSLERLGIPSKHPLGETKSPQRIFEDPSRTIGVRDYRREDSLRRIHWKATARRQQLQVRVYEPTATQQLAIFLNVATFLEAWQGIEPELLESAITVAASLASEALEQRYAVGLYANCSLPESDQTIKLPPGRSPGQLTAILEALAKASGFAITPLENLLDSEAARLPWGATLVIVTALVSEGLLAALLRLRQAGHRLTVVAIGERAALPEGMAGITIHRLGRIV